ncbi:DUF3306 domain-containing protein [Bradyrhizobium cenepequi]|uniref:DUF3306 domain-containing protein n=1 Tax=Bradyrhizobium cenepequi TaxID=2821403 RepID=UPI001CE3AE63|nr:DUF3306 domain-containing protein [Bradyrhizobium cenepequi]MCA6107742.1 DUF3306 domain-containing protein [Bradyrhizobium cenepequi]
MSEDKFLARWSRRKQEAKQEGRANATLPDAARHHAVQPASPPAVKDSEVEFDLSSLPPIDSITSVTDVTAFLRKGIPPELTRAALRRAWSADPTIRDFVGLAENAWDFNDPTAMPGFGPLDCPEGELAALVDRIVGGLRKSAEARPETSVEIADSSQDLHQAETASAVVAAEDAATTQVISAPAAAQPTVTENAESEREPIRRHTHGGALPR